MSRARQRFRQTDVAKAIKAVLANGLMVGRVDISPEGRIVVIVGAPEQAQTPTSDANEWDTVK